MRLPTRLLRRKSNVYKNNFGHVLILAGSRRYLGAAALCGLAAMRSGAGLVTLGIPQSLNNIVQKKISNVIMTLPLKETKEQTLALAAYQQIQEFYSTCNTLVIGPGLSPHPNTQKLILKIIATSPKPMVIDADALNVISLDLTVLTKTATIKILTPHPGEMSRLTQLKKMEIEKDRGKIAKAFAQRHHCTLLLKGHKTIVSSPGKKAYINQTGNSGMATAGSGDVLAGMISAFLGQGLSGFEAAKYGAYLHGMAGDLAAKKFTRVSMIASDIIARIPQAIQLFSLNKKR
jgi:ADP-dependent NAD(P)H-hydrate dehydratase / NAD(P)H-hydrate epimerase